MSLTGQWMKKHTVGGGGVKQSLLQFSTTTNSTLIDQVVFKRCNSRWPTSEQVWNEFTSNDQRPHSTAYPDPTSMLRWILSRWRLSGIQKGTNGYSYVLTLPRMMQNAYLHYVWSVWLVATLVASTSWSFPIACIALVWRTREKGTEFFCTTRTTKIIKFLRSWGHLSLTVIVATPIAVITSRVVIVAIAAISIALLSVAIVLVVSLVPVVVVALIPVLALA